MYFLTPKPDTGNLGLDVFYIILVTSFQLAILPSIAFLPDFDLLTLWLIFIFVKVNLSKGIFFAFIGALALESHGTYPSGFYVCSYWLMVILVNLIKNHISWRNLLPWHVVLIVSQAWLILFEVFVFSVKTETIMVFDSSYALGVFARLSIAVLSGIIAAKLIIANTEEHPA